jgi:hypothetical protein
MTWIAVLLRRLLYKIKVPRQETTNLSFIGFLEQRIAAENPGYEWTATEVQVGSAKEKIYYPVWNCWTIFYHPEIYDGLLMFFKRKFGTFIERNTKICALNQPSIFLLGKLDKWIQWKGAIVFPFDEHYKIPDPWKTSKLILFDVSLNSGKTMGKASQYFMSKNWKPSKYLVLLNNDFVPTKDFLAHDPDWPNNFFYIFTASTIVTRWKDQVLAKSLLIIKDALANGRPWNDPKVIESLKLLRSKPMTVENQLKIE